MIDAVGMLNGLSKEELEEVISTAKGLKQFATSGVAPVSVKRGTDPYDWILGVCVSVCRARGISMLDVEALKSSRLYKGGFRQPIVAVHAHIETFAKGRMEQRVVYRLAYQHMAERYHWGATRMVASTGQIPRLLDEMLPGYYQAGLMGVAMQRMAYDHN